MTPPFEYREEEAAYLFLTRTNFDRTHVEQEYKELLNAPKDASYSASDAHTEMNRYNNVRCLDATRVILPMEGPDQTSYINANWIKLRSTSSARFIATQCPTATTIAHFYRMVRSQKVRSIINIAKQKEIDVNRSLKYWADSGSTFTTTDGQLICTRDVKHSEKMNTEIVTLEHRRHALDTEPVTIRLYRYLGWDDFGLPDDAFTLLHLLEHIRKEGEDSLPIAIHCSAGLGRTGTALAIEDGIRTINKGCKSTVPKIVENLRSQRPGCVQKPLQYNFIYAALAIYSNCMLDNSQTPLVGELYDKLIRSPL